MSKICSCAGYFTIFVIRGIPCFRREYGGQISFMGGIDSASVDHEGWSREEIQREVKRSCDEFGTKYYIPCTSQGGPDSVYPGVYQVVSEEIDNYSKVVFK